MESLYCFQMYRSFIFQLHKNQYLIGSLLNLTHSAWRDSLLRLYILSQSLIVEPSANAIYGPVALADLLKQMNFANAFSCLSFESWPSVFPLFFVGLFNVNSTRYGSSFLTSNNMPV